MTAGMFLPNWLVNRADFESDMKPHFEDIVKRQARRQQDADGNYLDYAGQVEWIEHTDPYVSGSLWEVRAW